MLENFRATIRPDPRWGNKLGLKGTMNTFITFCARHRTEEVLIPQGIKHGWPTEINWKRLGKRVRNLQPRLQHIIDDPAKGCFYPKLKAEIEKNGKGSITGAKAAWATFEEEQPG